MNNIITPFKKVSKITYISIITCWIFVLFCFWNINAIGLIPKPIDVLNSIFDIISRKDFMDDFISSIWLTIVAMGIGSIIASILGYLYTIELFKPVIIFIGKLRFLTLTGLIFVFTQVSNDATNLKYLLLEFGLIPFFTCSMVSVITSIKRENIELCSTLRMNKWETLLEVVIIGNLHQLVNIIKQNFAICWLMITTVEGVNMSGGGLGTMLIKSTKYFNKMSDVFAILIIIFIIGIISDIILSKVSKLIFPYLR